MYRIREVDGHDDEITETLTDLHRLTFFDGASIPEFDWGYWWLAYHEANPVPLPESFRQRTRAMPDISAASAC